MTTLALYRIVSGFSWRSFPPKDAYFVRIGWLPNNALESCMGSTGVGWRLAQSVEPLCLIPLNQSYAPLWSRTWLLQQTWKLSVSHIVLIHPRLCPFICQDTWVIRIKQLIKPRSYIGLCRPGLNTSSVLGAVMLVSLRQVAVSCIWYLGTMSALRHLRRIGLRSRAT